MVEINTYTVYYEMENTCKTCGKESQGHKCADCGKECTDGKCEIGVKCEGCGSEKHMTKCSDCNEAEENCTCPAPSAPSAM